MNVHHLHHFLAAQPGTFGQRMSWRMAVGMIEAGRAVAGGALVDLVGLNVIPALVAAGAPAPALRTAIDAAVLHRSQELSALIDRSGGRAVFAEWCRAAGYVTPLAWPETLSVFRGTVGISPAEAAAGLCWTNSFELAAFYAARYSDEVAAGAVVLHARVPKQDVAVAIESVDQEFELVLAKIPATYEVLADPDNILEAALRALRRYKDWEAQGRSFIETNSGLERAAVAARERMAAVEVPPGASIAR